MTDRLNKTSICSIVFLDIIDYSKKPVSEQIEDKTFFNALINDAIENIPSNDRVILDTGDGAAITLMGAPEEALFIALHVRDGILERNKTHEQPILVRIGINLGSIRVMKDLNDRPNIIGDGINVAQRIMSFAGENQILVSRSYYEVTSRLTKEITNMFTYSGIKQDKHIREHEVYIIKSKSDDVVVMQEEPALYANSGFDFSHQRWKGMYIPLLFVGTFIAISAWYLLVLRPIPSVKDTESPVFADVKPSLAKPIDSEKTAAVSSNNEHKAGDSQEKQAIAKPKMVNPKIVKKDQSGTHYPHIAKAESRTENKTAHQTAMQTATPRTCSQAEIAMNQCR